MRVAVVGAGLAGLAASDALIRHGAEVVVLEARDRVGGRVWSRELENGSIVEMGAEFVLPGNDVVREVAAGLGLELADKGMRYGRREFRGGDPVDPEELNAALAKLEDALANLGGADRSARGLLDALPIDPAAREAIAARAEVSAASALADVEARALAGVAHIDDEPSPSVAGGNQLLATRMAARLGDAVQLSSPVRAIRWSDAAVVISLDDGEVEADACAVAVPATVVDRIDFEPGLPEPLASALAGIGYGHAGKLFVPLRAPAAASAVLSVPERYWAWTATGGSGAVQPVVSAFAGSPAALSGLAVEEGPQRWVESLAALRPDLDLDPSGSVLSTWDDDPWVGAAYSTRVRDASTDLLARRWDTLTFAGEHTAGEFHGLMEGALRSGRRAASALLGMQNG